MPEISLNINGDAHSLDVPADMPLLWALRDKLNMTGTKFGCGKGLCGTCTILLNGTATRSCTLPATAAVGMQITTIEGLDANGEHPVQKAWQEIDVPQCGYCQGGQILTCVSLLKNIEDPTDDQIDAAHSGNICRCGTYHRIRKAVKLAAEYTNDAKGGAQ